MAGLRATATIESGHNALAPAQRPQVQDTGTEAGGTRLGWRRHTIFCEHEIRQVPRAAPGRRLWGSQRSRPQRSCPGAHILSSSLLRLQPPPPPSCCRGQRHFSATCKALRIQAIIWVNNSKCSFITSAWHSLTHKQSPHNHLHPAS